MLFVIFYGWIKSVSWLSSSKKSKIGLKSYCLLFVFCVNLNLIDISQSAGARSVTEPTTISQKKRENSASRKLQREQSIIKNLVNSDDYDWRIRPRGTDTPEGPVVITANLYLRTISKVDDVNMEYNLHFTFREEWSDDRLAFQSDALDYVNLSPGQKIWMPDTFFQNEKDGKKHNIDSPNVLLRIIGGNTGKILYSVRMTLTLSCPMMLQNYPMDHQTCYVDFASYAYTTRDIKYLWKNVSKPIQIKRGLRKSLPSFTLTSTKTASCTSNTTTGTYSCLRTILVLKREFSYYLLQLYIPSFMLVAVSWVSFWLDKDSVPARVTLGVTTLLTMTTQASGINANLPPVSYTKAIDVWIGVCLAFIFGALLEFALVNYAARKDQMEDVRKRKMMRMQSSASNEPPPMQNQLYGTHNSQAPLTLMRNPNPSGNAALLEMEPEGIGIEKIEQNHFTSVYNKKRGFLSRLWNVKYRQKAKRIDVISRFIFPISFCLFNLIYWVKYLTPYLLVRPDEIDE